MAGDLFGNLGNLGGLMKGLSSFMPQDDPNTQLIKLQSEVSDLKKQETEIYIEIGKKAVEQYGLESFGDVADRMKLIQANLAAAEGKLSAAKGEMEARESAEKAAKAERTCPQCGHENPEGTKFCQECGSKLSAQGNVCPSCGRREVLPGVRHKAPERGPGCLPCLRAGKSSRHPLLRRLRGKIGGVADGII